MSWRSGAGHGSRFGSPIDMLKRCPDAELFLARTVSLGVVDARISDNPRCVFVFVSNDLGDTERDTVRLLARLQWPGQRIVLAPRVAIRETGNFPKIALDPDDDVSEAS